MRIRRRRPQGARFDETACFGCLQRLDSRCGEKGRELRAIRAIADWCDKALAAGPGYGVVECPHCGARCTVAVGDTGRTGCAACLRPLGVQPLLRMDCHALGTVCVGADDLDGVDDGLVGSHSRNEDAWMWLRP